MARCPSCHRRVAAGSVCLLDGVTVGGVACELNEQTPQITGVQIERAMARGGFSTVWRGHDVIHGEVALKVGHSSDAELQRRFQREGAALSQIGAPACPRLHRSGTLADGRPYLLLEWVAGETLAGWLERQPSPPSFETVLAWSLWLLDCLERVSAAGWLHGDLKPENLALCAPTQDTDGRALVFDFGSAHALEREASENATGFARGTAITELVGTAEYLAPERILGARGDERAEVYAVSVMLFELTTLRLPFSQRGRAVLHDHLMLAPARASAFAEVPASWDQLLLAGLAKDAAARPATLGELRRAVAACHADGAMRQPVLAPSAPRLEHAEEQPVALLRADGVRDLVGLERRVASRRGFLAWVTPRRVLAVFAAADCEVPLENATAARLELVRAGHATHVQVRLANLSLTRAADGAWRAEGSALEQSEAWSAARRDTIAPALTSTSSAAEPMLRAELIGRDDFMQTLRESLATWQAARAPAVLVTLGAKGAGKTRLAEEAARLARAMPGVRVLLVGGRANGSPLSNETLRARVAEYFPELANVPLTEALVECANHAPLALLIDDVEWVDDSALDALEGALLARSAPAIWLGVFGDPRFASVRGLWGARVEHFRRVELDALSAPAAQALASEWLRPAEYIPEAALARLAAGANCLPGALAEIVGHLRRAGLIKPRGVETSHYLDTAELANIPVPAMWQWVSSRELALLDPVLAGGARIVAVLGDPVEPDEVEAVQRELARLDPGSPLLDSTILLQRLQACGLLHGANAGDKLRFRVAALAPAIASLVEIEQRRAIHLLGLEFQQRRARRSPHQLEKMARHASALGRRHAAATAQRALADRAQSTQRVVEAEMHYAAALAHCDDPALRAELLLGRARSYCRLFRLEEAVADACAASELARDEDEPLLEILANLELATVLDWAGDYEASARAALRAVAIEASERLATAELASRIALAKARTAWRRADITEALKLLGEVAELPKQSAHAESQLIARLLLGCALVQVERLAEAEACFARALVDAEAAGDGLHLCATLGNRAFLWAAIGRPARCVEDLSRAVRVARTLGHPGTERTALLNLAEVLYWKGQDAEAAAWLEQARWLERRFIATPLASGVLLEARLALLQDQDDDARRALAWLFEHQLPHSNAANARALVSALVQLLRARGALVVGTPEGLPSFREIAETAGQFLPSERIELRYWWLRCRWENEPERQLLMAEAEVELCSDLVWLTRFRALASSPLSP